VYKDSDWTFSSNDGNSFESHLLGIKSSKALAGAPLLPTIILQGDSGRSVFHGQEWHGTNTSPSKNTILGGRFELCMDSAWKQNQSLPHDYATCRRP
jgi:hypothetical protein